MKLTSIFRSEKAEISAAAAIVSAIVSGIVLTGAGLALTHVIQIRTAAAVEFSATADRSNLGRSLTRDVMADSIVSATPTHLEFYTPTEGPCLLAVWDIKETEDGKQTVTRSAYAYPTSACDGSPSERPSISITTPVEDAEFIVRSRVGRLLTVEDRNPRFIADDGLNSDGSEVVEKANNNAWPESVELSTSDASFNPFARI